MNPMVPTNGARFGHKRCLTRCKTIGDGVHSGALGSLPLPKGVTEESLTVCRFSGMVVDIHVSFRTVWLLVEFLVMPICAYVLLTLVCPIANDLVVLVWLS